jgi:two-component system response regulator MprA
MLHVLVVDDEPDLLELCRIELTDAGHRVTVAADGAAALAAVEADTPDIVLLDFMLPGVDGLTVLERLSRGTTAPSVPVVMFSARNATHDTVRALAAGATAYVAKPIDFVDLERLLRDVVAESPAERELRRARSLARLGSGSPA